MMRSSADIADVAFEAAPSWRKRVLVALEGRYMTVVMFIVTVIGLLAADVQMAWVPKSADTAFVAMYWVTFAVFAVECVLLSLCKPRYFLSFFFFLDVISTIAVLAQIPSALDVVVGAQLSTNTNDTLLLARAARAARTGTRASRILRVSRIVRVLRVAKLYKLLLQRQKTGVFFREPNKVAPQQPDKTPTSKRRIVKAHSQKVVEEKQSVVGTRLAERTTNHLAFMVLTMIFVIPLLTFQDTNNAQVLQLTALSDAANGAYNLTQAEFDAAFASFITFANPLGTQEWAVLMVRVAGSSFAGSFSSPDLPAYRATELTSVYINDKTQALFSGRAESQKNAKYSMLETLLVVFVLAVGAFVFIRDANRLLIGPIERMTRLINRLRHNPLSRKMSTRGTTMTNAAGGGELMETAILEQTLEKLTGMLQIGFGEAGTAMIQKNISANGELNPMVDGRRMLAIFGFCDIRNFQEINELLSEDIMLFVNAVAEIVHTEVHRAGGAVNRNLGDTFVVVWRLPEMVSTTAMEAILERHAQAPSADLTEMTGLSEAEQRAVQEAQQLAAQALAAFLRVICSCANPSDRLEALLRNCPPSGGKLFPNNEVSVGIGLHIGWAIEGAIGSRFKIDASYLSPHVNMTARLMAATKQYKVPILFSGQFWSLLPKTPRALCRMLDRIAVKGSNVPISIHTYDVNTAMVMRVSRVAQVSTISVSRSAIERRRSEHKTKSMISKATSDFDNDKFLISLQIGIVRLFKDNFDLGLRKYLEGDWEHAIKCLQVALRFKPNDGPCENLIAFMTKSGSSAAANWQGYRALQSK
ncbi:Guanylate cyclase domain-containing protein [Plasmodiophora brassicae]|uniref:Guanylate cyclase domain-containing protein n=2 Tax=Plasmodiophora brassicae TaxID=37360 RepID=A0A3P3YB59_PLABS|nr:unnamed protein product [Plasmodiophora brassicae]